MKQMLNYFVLLGFSTIPGMCQEATVASPPLRAAQPGNSILERLLSASKPTELAPLTRGERLRLYLATSYGVGSTTSAAAAAGFQQLFNTPSEWNQGSEGYRKRFASAYATHVLQGSIEYGASALLHEDNRYRRSIETGVWRRTMHAISGAVSSTDDAGRQHLSYSRVGGAGGAAFIRRTWQPSSTAGVSDAFGAFGIALSAQVGGNVFREFCPDIRARLLKRK